MVGKMIQNTSRRRYLVLLVVLLLINFSHGCKKKDSSNMEGIVDQSNRIENVFEKMKTVCFGRFLVDIPESASVDYGPASVEAGITFHKDEASRLPEILAMYMASNEKNAENIPQYSLEKLPLIGKIYSGIIPNQKIAFGVLDSVSYAIYSFIPIENNLFIQKYGSLPNQEIISKINNIASNLSLRSERVIPAEQGICIEGGFVSTNPEHERVAIGVRFQEFPDLRLSIDAHKNQKYLQTGSSPKRLREAARKKAEARGLGGVFSGIKILREGTRHLGTWEGEEIASRRPAYKNDTDAHEFRFHSLGSVNDAFHPALDIRLDTGVQGNAKASLRPSITDSEALALWDKVISTIRIRKPSDATRPLLVSHKLDIGQIRRTGEICSQAGYWECTHAQDVKEGKLRLFGEGDRMPYVFVAYKKSFWDLLRAKYPMPIEVAWKLVGYEDLKKSITEDNVV